MTSSTNKSTEDAEKNNKLYGPDGKVSRYNQQSDKDTAIGTETGQASQYRKKHSRTSAKKHRERNEYGFKDYEENLQNHVMNRCLEDGAFSSPDPMHQTYSQRISNAEQMADDLLPFIFQPQFVRHLDLVFKVFIAVMALVVLFLVKYFLISKTISAQQHLPQLFRPSISSPERPYSLQFSLLVEQTKSSRINMTSIFNTPTNTNNPDQHPSNPSKSRATCNHTTNTINPTNYPFNMQSTFTTTTPTGAATGKSSTTQTHKQENNFPWETYTDQPVKEITVETRSNRKTTEIPAEKKVIREETYYTNVTVKYAQLVGLRNEAGASGIGSTSASA
ncbi:hypothetical protein DFH27DRAFT_652124 [Peziza echinospora]|nr:hypothetical protein DFH27DRAFT_652124 [Peziza echinospora]